jgi:hypothetical protein
VIAVSSFRAMGDSQEVANNQIRAIESWRPVFNTIFLFGAFDKSIAHPRIHFVEGPDFPPLSLLFLLASTSVEPAAILNADIVVSNSLSQTVDKAFSRGADALTSRRYEFDPQKPDFERAKVVDLGADFFCAPASVWARAWRAVPTCYRIGNGGWDNWLLGFLGTTFKRTFADITPARAIFHPRHSERKRIPLEPPPLDRYNTSSLGFPRVLTLT